MYTHQHTQSNIDIYSLARYTAVPMFTHILKKSVQC